MTNQNAKIYAKYTDLQLSAINTFFDCESAQNVRDLCPSAYAHSSYRERFAQLMDAFLELDPRELDTVDFSEINEEFRGGANDTPVAHQAHSAVAEFRSGYLA